MDATDAAIVRAIVAMLAMLNCAVWFVVWHKAMQIRSGVAGMLLKARAAVFFTYTVNVAVMSVLILLPILNDSYFMAVWRNVTRVHSQLVLLIVGVDIVYNGIIKRHDYA